MMRRFLTVLLFACCGAEAQWSNDPAVNTPVFTGPNSQFAPLGVADGSGGAFAFWLHSQTGASGLFAQRMDAFGNRVLPPTGVQVFLKPVVGAVFRDAIPAGSGGAIVTWSLNSVADTSVRAQKIDSSGSLVWPSNGVIVSDALGYQTRPRLVSDGSGGAIIVWQDSRAGGIYKIHAQHLNSSGQPQWTLDGIPICGTTPNSQLNPRITSDGNGGAVVVWEDSRYAPYVWLFAQRITSAGQRQWPDSAVLISYGPTSKFLRGIVPDETGGAIVCWQDVGFNGSYVLAQRVNGLGNVLWNISSSVRVSSSGKDVNPLVVSDGSGGAVFAWEDSSRGSRQVDIYAQRVGSTGALLWPPADSVSTAPFEQYYFSMVENGVGGAIIAWTDARNWPTPTGVDIYAQSVDGSGLARWAANGAVVSQPPSQAAQTNVFLVTDGAGGAIALWDDNRNAGNGSDIYAQGLAALGLPLRITNSITQLNTNYPFVINTTTLVTANFSVLGSVNSMTVEAYLNTAPTGLTKALPRYLNLSTNGSGFTATLALHYTDAEVRAVRLVNGDANLKAYRKSGSVWTLAGGTVDTNTNTVTVSGVTEFSQWALRDPSDTVVTNVKIAGEVPGEFHLEQNYPNPFNPLTRISVDIAKPNAVSVIIYDVTGQEVIRLMDGEFNGGRYEVTWSGKDALGRAVASGVYIYRLEVGDFTATKKMLYLK